MFRFWGSPALVLQLPRVRGCLPFFSGAHSHFCTPPTGACIGPVDLLDTLGSTFLVFPHCNHEPCHPPHQHSHYILVPKCGGGSWGIVKGRVYTINPEPQPSTQYIPKTLNPCRTPLQTLSHLEPQSSCNNHVCQVGKT